MKAEIITIGDEILIGQIIDTNSSWIADQLVSNGIECIKITTVADQKSSILNTIIKSTADLIIMTGGLGPTKDDITKTVLCDFFNDQLIVNPKVLNDISQFFERKKRTKIIDLNKDQALVPSKARIIRNIMGTAPGLWFNQKGVDLLALPGVPYEMKRLFKDFLKLFRNENKLRIIVNKTIYIKNIPESQIADIIKEWENTLHKDIKLAYLPRPGLVRLRLSTVGNDETKQNKLINSELEKLKEYIEFNESEINLNQLVHDKFIKSNFTLSVAESCSSGIIASELTSNAGSSKYFSGGIIAYSDQIKQDILDIDKEIIKKQSSVCSDVAKLMVENVAKKFSSDFSISTTGYASQSNDNNITVGKVFIGIKTPNSLFVEEFLFSGDRKIIIQQVKDKALELLLNEIKKIK
ncbi:MAG: CinA family nicotinamide mononucleotide deamidase-related protein [Flavobacteriales bacterium]